MNDKKVTSLQDGKCAYCYENEPDGYRYGRDIIMEIGIR